ncbi:MAG: lytic transglycosylase domain-containing protein [Oligoflexus sp.]
MLNQAYIIILLVFATITGKAFGGEKTGQEEANKFDISTRFSHIILQLEDEKAKNIEKLEDIFLNSSDLESRVAASLSLAVFHNRNNPRLSQQYLATAMELKDPFAEDRYLAATAAFFRIMYYHKSQTTDLIRELKLLTENHHLPWKMLKSSFEMLLDYHLKVKDYDGYLATFENYQNKIPRFAVEDKYLKQFCMILKITNQPNKYLRSIENLASRYPLSPEAIWAFEELVSINENSQLSHYAMTLNFLRKIHLNSIIDPERKALILAQLEKPLRISLRSGARLLTDFEKIRFLLRLNEHDRALQLAESMATESESSFMKIQGGLWKAHILGESGYYAESIDEFKKHITDKNDIGAFFLESYATNLMRDGQYLEAAQAYQKVRNVNDHYRLRWYTFWSLSKGQKSKDALAILEKHSHVFFEDQRSPDSHLYWTTLQQGDIKKLDIDPDSLFTGHTRHYYSSLLKARQERKEIPNTIELDRFQQLSLGFDFEYFIAKEIGASPYQIAELDQQDIKQEHLLASNSANFSLPSTALASISIGQMKEQKKVLPFQEEVSIIANNLELDPYLLYALMKAESAFNPVAMSSVGARGIMQLMPYTAMKLASIAGDHDFHLDHLGDPILSIVYGSLYFKMLNEAFQGNTFLTIAAYNAGPHAVYRWLQGCNTCQVDEFVEYIPFRETRNYVKKVLSYYVAFQLEKTGTSPLERLPALPDPSTLHVDDLF